VKEFSLAVRYDDIGNRLKAFRLGSGLSADEIARRAGISRTALYRFEKGELVKIGGLSYPRLRSYALNAYAGWTGGWDSRMSTSYRIFRKHSDLTVAMPSGIFTFMDVNPDSICWPYFGVLMQTEGFFNFPNSSHNRGGVIAFSDGHVEHHRWKDQRTITAYSSDYHRHNEPSMGNQDLVWIRDRTTIRR